MPRWKYLALVASLLCATQGRAGWSGGGGGKISLDDTNPWFLQNTKVATYCIALDKEHFGADLSDVRAAILRGFEYWRYQFENYYRVRGIMNVDVHIGTQIFQEVPCDKKPDVSFQMGTLNDAQKSHFENPKDFIGMAIRTDYDKKQMRGRGFIYISPETGPLAPSYDGVDPKRWSYASTRGETAWILRLVMMHEMGHIFGVPHLGSVGDLMGEDFPDYISSKEATIPMTGFSGPPLFMMTARDSTMTSCQHVSSNGGPKGDLEALFGLPLGSYCFRLETTRMTVKVSVAPTKDGPFQEIITAGDNDRDIVNYDSGFGIRLYLPPEETLIPGMAGRKVPIIEGINDTQNFLVIHRARGNIQSVLMTTSKGFVNLTLSDRRGKIYQSVLSFAIGDVDWL